MSYSKSDRRKLVSILHRAAWLSERVRARHTFDLAELAALKWALDVIVEARGSLPEDLETVRASIDWSALTP